MEYSCIDIANLNVNELAEKIKKERGMYAYKNFISCIIALKQKEKSNLLEELNQGKFIVHLRIEEHGMPLIYSLSKNYEVYVYVFNIQDSQVEIKRNRLL